MIDLSLLLLALIASPDAKQAALAEAKRHVPEGQERFKAGDYEEALASFRQAEKALEAADVQAPPTLDRILGRCYDQLGQVVPALRHFKRFLNNAETDDPELADAVRRAEQAVDRLEGHLERTTMSFDVLPDGTEVRLGSRTLGVTPLAPMKVAPGPQQITLWKEGYEPHSVDVQVVAGTSAPIVVRMAKTVEKPSASVRDSSMSWWWVGGVALGAAALTTGLVIALGADDEASGPTTPVSIPFRSTP